MSFSASFGGPDDMRCGQKIISLRSAENFLPHEIPLLCAQTGGNGRRRHLFRSVFRRRCVRWAGIVMCIGIIKLTFCTDLRDRAFFLSDR